MADEQSDSDDATEFSVGVDGQAGVSLVTDEDTDEPDDTDGADDE